MAYNTQADVEWRVVADHCDYSVSNTGLLYSRKTNRLIGMNYAVGYRVACIDGKREYIHRLVAEAFIPNPNNLKFINHKDENGHNNNIINLEWCDQAYNNRYGTSNARQSKTKKEFFATEEGFKAREEQSIRRKEYFQTDKGKKQIERSMRPVKCINTETLEVVREFPSLSSTDELFGKNAKCNVLACCVGKIRHAYGYKWEYAQQKGG